MRLSDAHAVFVEICLDIQWSKETVAMLDVAWLEKTYTHTFGQDSLERRATGVSWRAVMAHFPSLTTADLSLSTAGAGTHVVLL